MNDDTATGVMKNKFIISLLLVYHEFLLLDTLIVVFRSGQFCFGSLERNTAL